MNLVEFLQLLVEKPAVLEAFQKNPTKVMNAHQLSDADQETLGARDDDKARSPINQVSVLAARDQGSIVVALHRQDTLVGQYSRDTIYGYPAHQFVTETISDPTQPNKMKLSLFHVVNEKRYEAEIVEMNFRILDSQVDFGENKPANPPTSAQQLTVQGVGRESTEYLLATNVENNIDQYSTRLQGVLGPPLVFNGRTFNMIEVGADQVMYAFKANTNEVYGVRTGRMLLRIWDLDE